jgi:phosphatidylglycerophosphate synthase
VNISNEKLIRLWATKNKDDEWWSSFVTSVLAIIANYFLVDIKWLTPNIITLLSFVVALISVVFIVIGGSINFIIAAVLIQLSHVLDCMDGQMARYRMSNSPAGSYYDKLTDHIQIILWFGAVGYAAYSQSQSVAPIFLAFTGVAFFSLRGYVKYMYHYTKMDKDSNPSVIQKNDKAGIGFSVSDNIRWFLAEQRKILDFDEGVFIFMLSIALIFNVLTPMLLVFAISQLYYGIKRSLERGRKLKKQNEY